MDETPSRSTPPDTLKSQTSRISLDSARPAGPTDGAGPAPGMPARAIPHTIRLKRPPTSPITLGPRTLSPAAAAPAAPGKKVTSRIVLDSPEGAKPAADVRRVTGPVPGIPAHGGPIPQTIRLKRPPTSPVSLPAPDAAPTIKKVAVEAMPPPVTEAPTVAKQLVMPKTSTSRIVLDGAGAHAPEPAAAAGAPQPKTIRLKRPSSMSPAAEPGPAAGAAPADRAKKAETSKIELPPDAEAAGSMTQRKTIKIKRSDRNTAMRTVKITPPPAEAPAAKPATDAARAPEAAAGEVAPGADPWTLIVSAAAVLCIAALVYLMAVEAAGLAWPLPTSLHVH